MTTQPPNTMRVLVIEDDPVATVFIESTLGAASGVEVVCTAEPTHALELVQSENFDVIVTDVELPGMSGLELLDEVRSRRPGIPVAVMTAHANIEYAVRALRHRADEFILKPLEPVDFVAKITALGRSGRRSATGPTRVVLAVGAHPDDVEIGVGGLLALHRYRGDKVAILTLTRGARGGGAGERADESANAAKFLGAQLFLEDMPDTRISQSDPTVGAVERVIAEIDPTIIYTHSDHDLHQDHRAVHQATLVAARRVPTLACFQSPSATLDFRPNRFAGIDGYTQDKLDLLNSFASQIATRPYLEPDIVLATARYWSRYGETRFAEPLEVIRDQAGTSVVPSSHQGADNVA